jgi:Mg-chelatase subunit ChlD
MFTWLASPASAQPTGKGKPRSVADFPDILRLLDQKVPQKKIIESLRRSSTHFVLSAQQIEQLKAKGASPELIREVRRLAVRPMPSDVRNIAIVLDCSGSMLDKIKLNAQDKKGKSKMDLAKEVVISLISRIRNGRYMTFVVYGLDHTRGCNDVNLWLPLTEVTDEIKEKLIQDVQGFNPDGHTPLAKAMEMAGEQLEGARGISMMVVITDGMESCKGKPGEVADELIKRVDLGNFPVDLIGLGVDREEMDALKKLNRKSLKVYDAVKGEDLSGVINERINEREKIAAAKRKAIEKLKQEAKAKLGPLEITLAWNAKNDLDLHVIPPNGQKIYYKNIKANGGYLDVDRNVNYATASMKPIEHVVWDKKAPPGHYKVYVNHYSNHGNRPGTKDPTPYTVAITTNDQIEWFEGKVKFVKSAGAEKLVCEFDLDKDGYITIRTAPRKKPNPPRKDGKPAAALDPVRNLPHDAGWQMWATGRLRTLGDLWLESREGIGSALGFAPTASRTLLLPSH